MVSLADAWRSGAYDWDADQREKFANDFMNLEALDAETNEDKNDETAAGWLPADDDNQCALVVRQISIKQRYETLGDAGRAAGDGCGVAQPGLRRRQHQAAEGQGVQGPDSEADRRTQAEADSEADSEVGAVRTVGA